MKRSWGRTDQPDLAVEKILQAAEKAFVELGVSAAGMAEIASYAGCSRGTLYRYFPNRHELHMAYIERTGLDMMRRLEQELAAVTEPKERLVEAILRSVREVRNNPATAAWFDPGAAGIAARMSRSSEVIEMLTARFVAALLGPRGDDPDGRLLARWFVRVIISLLTLPGDDEAEERALVERFVAPMLSVDLA